MGEERRYELQEPEHEYFGNFQQRPNDLEDSCVQTKITPPQPSTVSSETSVDETIQPKDQTEPPKPAQASPQTDTKPPLPPPQIRSSTPSPWSLRASTTPHPLSHISTPLTLSSLSSITGPHRSRNRLVSVLALVHSVDPDTIKRPKMPLKRDIRITDTSTDKIVTLSIFTTPLDIIPSPESVVLFRNVTTHDFKGGNLNAYPKQCEGKDWCIPDPFCVSGTHAGLEETRRDLLARIEQTRAAKGMTGASDNNEMQQSE